MANTEIPCLILCGGASRRFGSAPKALAKLGNKTVLRHVIDRIAPQVGEISLNAPESAGYEVYDLPLRPDGSGESKGPLAGVLAAMQWADSIDQTRVLTCSNDTPFIPVDWAGKLGEVQDGKIVVPNVAGETHFVCALWQTSMESELSTYLEKGRRSVQGFISSQSIEKIEFSYDDRFDPFFNINTSDDLKTAENILQNLIRR